MTQRLLPTEPVGSLPRPIELIDALEAGATPDILAPLYEAAIQDSLKRFEETRSPIIADGEQTKSSFAVYPLDGATNLNPEGFKLTFNDGHFRQFPLITEGPFRFSTYAVQYLEEAKRFTDLPIKQAVTSASLLSLLYPEAGIEGYSREQFLADLIDECEKDIRLCLEAGAANVQIDFTEGRLSLKLDPSGQLLKDFIALNNQVLDRFSTEEQEKIGVHVCSGGDCDASHCADVDYNEFLPHLFNLHLKNFYIELAGEKDRPRVLQTIKDHLQPHQLAFIGVVRAIDSQLETPEIVCERILEAAQYIPLEQLGTTDDCGFSPFTFDRSTSRDLAFAKIKARIEGTALASKILFPQA